MSWYGEFTRELERAGMGRAEADDLAAAARAEAVAGGIDPSEIFGPAVIHARTVAAAARDEQGAHSAPLPPAAAEVLLRVRDLHVRRGRRRVLRGVDLEVRRGEIVAVVGANGCGKSTLLQACAGMLRPTSGSIERVDDFGYAPQSIVQSPLLSIDEHLRLFGAARGMSSGRAIATGEGLLARLGWRASGGQLLGTLSGGSQQKVNVAIAELHAPSLLLLDEPYQGFDALAHDDLWALMDAWRRASTGILVITHLLTDTTRVDTVIELPSPEESLP